MANPGKKHHIHDAAWDGASPDAPQTRTTRSALASSSALTMGLRGLVGLIAVICSLAMVTPRNRPVPFREPRSDAVDHVNP